MAQDILLNMHDIAGLDPIGCWPLALGWWLVIIGGLLSIFLSLRWYFKYRDFRSSWRYAIYLRLEKLSVLLKQQKQSQNQTLTQTQNQHQSQNQTLRQTKNQHQTLKQTKNQNQNQNETLMQNQQQLQQPQTHQEQQAYTVLTKKVINELSECLRQIAINQYPRESCASISGKQWLIWLSEHDPKHFNWQQHGNLLLMGPYAPNNINCSSAELGQLIQAAKRWLK